LLILWPLHYHLPLSVGGDKTMKLVPFLIVIGAYLDTPSFLPAPTETTVCEVVLNPESFNETIVKIKALVIAGYEEFELK
jgi:hypothetical protein